MRGFCTILLLVPALLVSCLKQPGNHPPVIEAIILDPAENHTPGGDISISALVRDADGDPVSSLWSSEGGQIRDPLQLSTSWELYTTAEPLSYESITLTVSDGKETVSRTRTIQVSEGLMVWGHTYFAGTRIPVPGVEVTIGKFSTVSDEQGYYSIEYLKEGNTLTTARKDGFDTYQSIVYVDHPKSSYHIPLTSRSQTQSVSGSVRTLDNLTFQGLKVVLLNPDGSESTLQTLTDASGAFQIPDVPVGTRQLLIRSSSTATHFLNDSLITPIELDHSGQSFHTRIKVKRALLSDSFLSEMDRWEREGSTGDGFYMIGKGESLHLKEFMEIPPDAESAELHINSFVVGGCDLVGQLPSHRVWISNTEGEYLGGISWGGEGNNFPAIVSWTPAASPTFVNIYGREIKLHLEVFGENTCVPDPYWRIYQVAFSYYY